MYHGFKGLGCGLAGAIAIGGQSYSSVTTELDAALHSGKPVTSVSGDRTYTAVQFNGGWLIDGCPLNVLFGQGWAPGQVEALKAAGVKPACMTPGTKDYTDFYGVPAPAPAVAAAAAIPPPVFNITGQGSQFRTTDDIGGSIGAGGGGSPDPTTIRQGIPVSGPIRSRAFDDDAVAADQASATAAAGAASDLPWWIWPAAIVGLVLFTSSKKGRAS